MNNPQEAARHSFEALAAIHELEKRPEFTDWFMGHLRDLADEAAQEVLHDNALTPGDREALRNHRLGLLEAIAFVAVEKNAHESILKSMGMGPEDAVTGGR